MDCTLKELASLAKFYLLQEYSIRDEIVSDPDTARFFRDSKPPVAPAPIPKASPPPPPLPKPIIKVKAPEKKPIIEKKAIPEPEEPILAPLIKDLSEWRKIISEKFPGQKIIDHPPDDSEAKKQVESVVILWLEETPDHLAFLENVAKAIDGRYCKTQLMPLEKFSLNPGLKLVLAKQEILNQLNLPVQTIPLKEISQYLQQPALKTELWKQIKNVF